MHRVTISILFVVGMACKELGHALVHGPPACIWAELITLHKELAEDNLYRESNQETPIWGCVGCAVTDAFCDAFLSKSVLGHDTK